MTYTPQPIDTTKIALSQSLLQLTESLAAHAHDIWAKERIKQGWTYGPQRNDELKEHPCLVPYDQLDDSEKQFDRNAALETLKLISALGYQISPPTTIDRDGIHHGTR